MTTPPTRHGGASSPGSPAPASSPGVPAAGPSSPDSPAPGATTPPPHRDPAEDRAAGRAARSVVPRHTLGGFAPAPDRPDPVEVLVEQGRTRVPELLPIRYGRMVASPFAFFRGAAAVMAADLAAATPVGIEVQLCGDAHLSNFGIFGTPERRLVFDLNDFDETARGPFEWDVKRLVASLEIAGRERGFPGDARARAVRDASRAYRRTMADLAGLGNLDVWYTSLDVEAFAQEGEVKGETRRLVQHKVARARAKDNRQAYAHLVHDTPDGPRFVPSPPLVVPIEDLTGVASNDPRTETTSGDSRPGTASGDSRADAASSDPRTDTSASGSGPETASGDWFHEELLAMVSHYAATLSPERRALLASYRTVHAARKVVGVGSVGTRCWIVLLLGQGPGDPLVLQVKEAEESVVARFTRPSPYANQGERVVVGQRMMQAAGDLFLGWDRVERGLDGVGRDFYIRQLRDWKGSVDVAELTPATMRRYAAICGRTLARAHARTGNRVALDAYLGTGTTFDEAMVAFAADYAEQNERDLAALRSAVEAGHLEARPGT